MNQILSAVINGAVNSVPFAAAAWLILRVVPRTILNAATRYAIWWIILAMVLLLPAAYVPVHSHAGPAYVKSLAPVPELVPDVEQGLRWRRFPIEIAAGMWTRWIGAAWAVAALLLLVRLAI